MADGRAVLEAALREWLDLRGVSAEVTLASRATVGLSQETWFGAVTGASGARQIVLRLPTAASGRRSILGQHAALLSVSGRELPIPGVVWFDGSAENGFGRPFLVMDRTPGIVPVGWHEISEPERSRLATEAIEVLADIHAIDVAGTALRDSEGSPLMDLDGLRRLFERLAPLPRVVDGALWWLERHRPGPAERRTIVHGDYRMGNMTVADGRITGVLDWEMAAPGDPLIDLAWCFIPVWTPSLVDEVPLYRRYAELTGAPLDDERLHWHRVLGLLRLAYYALSGTRVFDAGRSSDLRVAALRLQLPVALDRVAAAISGEPLM